MLPGPPPKHTVIVKLSKGNRLCKDQVVTKVIYSIRKNMLDKVGNLYIGVLQYTYGEK